jgi:elongation factor P--beta-lysine ligase
MNTNTQIKNYFVRENIIKAARQFFYDCDFHEVIPQVLNTALPLEANLYPFSTVWKTRTGDKKLYLPLSPERSIKRMLGNGIGNCFALAKSFRNLEQEGSQHLPEFLMLEWYRKQADYTNIMTDAEQLLSFISEYLTRTLRVKAIQHHDKKIILNKKWKTYSLNELFKTYVDIDLKAVIQDDELLFSIAKKRGYIVNGATWGEVYDQLFVNEIESELPMEPLFLIDFPSRVSPLCKQKKNESYFAERFELYIAGVEIGNGNTENTDCDYVRKTFESESLKTNMPIDEDFLNSLNKMNDSTYAGIGLGIDRLAMLFCNESTIQSIEPAGGDYYV